VVLVELSGDSWIEVYDAEGRRLLYGLEPAGAQHRLRGTRPFRVFLGNAPGVAVEINGRPFDLSPLVRRDNTARFTLQ
jgi:cytoskeleton protein RodZ